MVESVRPIDVRFQDMEITPGVNAFKMLQIPTETTDLLETEIINRNIAMATLMSSKAKAILRIRAIGILKEAIITSWKILCSAKLSKMKTPKIFSMLTPSLKKKDILMKLSDTPQVPLTIQRKRYLYPMKHIP